MLPIPPSEYHYADPSQNDEAQSVPIRPFVDRLHFPTLGAPALLTPDRPLEALVSLPEAESPSSITLTLVDRHTHTSDLPLTLLAPPVSLGLGPSGKTGRRQLWHVRASLTDVPPRLYDLRLRSTSSDETQPNAVRVYAEITGREKVVFCGDAQFHVDNAVCLRRFVEHMNARDDVAWIALIGDVCDNHVASSFNILKLAISAKPGPVAPYYEEEYPGAREILVELNKPVVLVPGNHDGMVAYHDYLPGTATDTYLGPDPKNQVAYDGLHHFRRTFGPLFHRFDWHKTRYLATNTFELDRHQRLGYHAIVANWGGWMRPEQVAWLADEIADAKERGLHRVAFMHHDPRGGANGKHLGYYKEYRSGDYQSTGDIAIAYARYLFGYARAWQQEWMRWREASLQEHPVKKLLSMLLESELWAVVMGHDNESWVDSYFEAEGIFTSDAHTLQFAASPEEATSDPNVVKDAADLMKDNDVEGLMKLLEDRPEEERQSILRKAYERVGAEPGIAGAPAMFAPDEVNGWGLRARAAIHFVHVDDIGAYKYSRERDFKDYGYVVAELRDGKPVRIQRFDASQQTPGKVISLLEED